MIQCVLLRVMASRGRTQFEVALPAIAIGSLLICPIGSGISCASIVVDLTLPLLLFSRLHLLRFLVRLMTEPGRNIVSANGRRGAWLGRGERDYPYPLHLAVGARQAIAVQIGPS